MSSKERKNIKQVFSVLTKHNKNIGNKLHKWSILYNMLHLCVQ